MEQAKRWPGQEAWAPMAAGLALLSASLANFLNRNDYDFLRTDVALVIALFIAISAAMTLFYNHQRQLVRSLLEGLLAAIFVDLNSTEILAALGAGAAVAGYTYWKRSSLVGPMAVIGSIILLTTLVGFQGRWSWIRSESRGTATSVDASQPAVLHIILDEHLGLEGFPLLGRDGVVFRDELKSAYVAAGFTVFGRAYSEHMHTVNAIPDVLNYGLRPGSDPSRKGVRLGPTEHLRSLANSGYALNIFQSDFADICSDAAFARCTTYDSFSLRPLLDAPLTTVERSNLIVLKLLTLSDVAFFTVRTWNQVARVARRMGADTPHLLLKSSSLTSSVASLAALDELNAQLSRARPGEAHIVHLLVPHYPYVVDRDCKLLPRSNWNWRNSDSTMTVKQRAYMAQLRCVTKQVMKTVDVYRSSPGGRNGAVVIHGDHGSRLSRIDPTANALGRFSDADQIAAFSTLFAVRTASGQGGYVEGAQPIAPLVRDFTERKFASAPHLDPTAVRGVVLDDINWRPVVRVPLAEGWVNSAPRKIAKR